MKPERRRFPRPSLVMLPNGFTLANLFFGIFAIVSASRGQHVQAGWYIVLGAFCDAIDGRIARATNTGSAFGEELDSLVDAISFGVAPALLVFKWSLYQQPMMGLFVSFLFAGMGAVRLARFNVLSMNETGKPTKPGKYIVGLPVPGAAATGRG